VTLPLLAALVAALALVAAQARAPQNGPNKDKEEPPFHEYKGVHLGMSVEDFAAKYRYPIRVRRLRFH